MREYEYAGHEWRLEFKRRRKRNTLQTNTIKTRKTKKKAPTEFDMNNIRSWIVIIFEIFAPIVFFFFFSFCSNGKKRKRNGNQEKRQANQTEMSVNYWKNVFLSPLCDRSYKTGIYFDSAWIDFALTGANIRVKNHEVCERVRARHSGWKIPILCMHGQTTSQPKRVINVCTSLQTISNRLLEFGNAIILVRVHTYIQHLLGLDWTGCCRFIYMKFFFSYAFSFEYTVQINC